MEWISHYWLQVVFGSALSILTWLVKTQYRKQKAIEAGIQALLRDRIIQCYYYAISKGCISLHRLESANKMFEEYEKLKGNGTVCKLVADLNKLPVVDD